MKPEEPINQDLDFHKMDESSTLENLKLSKIIFPILLGLSVVIYLLSRQLDLNELAKLDNNGHTIFWVMMAVTMYILRHLFYAWRLRIMSDYVFSWRKAIQLIVIWEFSTAVSPTSVGGAGVAFFLLAQEKLSGAKTISVVLYSMVIDTLFIVCALLLLYFTVGPIMIRPGMKVFSDIDGYGITFLTVLAFMCIYGSIFFYGLFINPSAIKRLLLWVSRFSLLKRFKNDLQKTAIDVVISATEIAQKPMSFYLKTFGCTMGAWTVRFFAINCLIIAFVADFDSTFYDHFIIFSRAMAMHTIEAFSPTPGAAGVAEYLFGGFFKDYIPVGIAVLMALIWRLIGYYSYLIAGVIVIPLWFRERKLRKSNP